MSPTDIRDWTIYKITSPSGRVYIGLTLNLPRREKNYRNLECKKQHILYNSIKKHGWNTHKFDVIDTFTSEGQFALGKEIFWIRSFMSNKCKWPKMNGINSNDGGQSNTGLKMSEESKRKISLANKGRKVSEEGRLRMSTAFKGKGLGRKISQEWKDKIRAAKVGVSRSEETKKKLSIWRTGRKFPDINLDTENRRKMYERNKKPIIQYDLMGNIVNEFTSVLDATKNATVSMGSIFNSLSGRVKNPTKFIFKYK